MRIVNVPFSITLFLVHSIQTAPAPELKIDKAIAYLSRYGYLENIFDSNRISDVKVVNSAVADFQRFAGLEATGKLDNETVHFMGLPRCGVRDLEGTGNDTRSKRYALQGSKWKIKNISYKISKYPSMLDKESVDTEIHRALNVWSQYTDLSFEKTSVDAKIDITFVAGAHGDQDPFDGQGGTLAHAFFPVFGGDAHFDASEQWTFQSYRGTNLFQVAAHEFGHSLGLSHSDVQDALMAPFYRGFDPIFKLDDDDITAVQALYGPKTLESRHGTSDENNGNSPEDPLLCRDYKFDTIFTSSNGETYIFKGEHYWKLARNGLAHGFPKNISMQWSGLPGNIDAAFTYKNGKTYFFKETQYWRYIGVDAEPGYPKLISQGFPGIPDHLDAAVIWSGNGKLYFFKGTKFWRFDTTLRPPVKNTYPKSISNWDGVPDYIDAAFQYIGYTYFFKDGIYYRINDSKFAVDTDDPAYPRSTAYWWFGCKTSPRGTIRAWKRR